MTTGATAYPLAWPHGVARTTPTSRQTSQFKTALDGALRNVENSLRRFGEATGKQISPKDIVISSNFTLGIRKPEDPGCAVWFVWDDAERCIAIDRYTTLQCNLQAIHHILEARITEARHGGLRIVRQTFTGFLALPPPDQFGGRTCWEVLGIQPHAPRERIEAAYRDLARTAHPDAGGSGADMADINAARAAALASVGQG